MTFKQVDAAIQTWAVRNGLPLSTRYQDVDVRSFELAGPLGRAQIWVDTSGGVTVHVWDYRRRKQTFVSDPSSLEAELDQALQVARGWCGSP